VIIFIWDIGLKVAGIGSGLDEAVIEITGCTSLIWRVTRPWQTSLVVFFQELWIAF